MGADMVDIYVGPKSQLFRVHKSFLTSKISFFEKMFSGEFKEAKENKATFPEDDPEAFEILIEWVYTGILRPLDHLTDGMGNKIEDKDGFFSLTWKFFRTYILANKLCINSLMDMLMSARIRLSSMEKVPSGLKSLKRGLSSSHEAQRYESIALISCITFWRSVIQKQTLKNGRQRISKS